MTDREIKVAAVAQVWLEAIDRVTPVHGPHSPAPARTPVSAATEAHGEAQEEGSQ